MMPISASASDNTQQTSGPLGSATTPIFSKTVVVGRDNSANPSTSATASAAAGAGPGAAASLPQWLGIAALAAAGLAVVWFALRKK